jgi:tetratricopeptide (TPR) repeat protein
MIPYEVTMIAVLVGFGAWYILLERWRKQAADFYEAGNYAEAEKVYSKILFFRRDSSYFYHWRAESRVKLGKLDDAIADYGKMANLKNNETTNAYLKRAEVFISQQKFEQASQDIEFAIRREPENYWVYFCRAGFYIKQEDHNRAMADYEKAISLIEMELKRLEARGAHGVDSEAVEGVRQHQVWAYERLGTGYSYLKDYDRALEKYNESIRIDGKSPIGYLGRATILQDKGDFPAALADYDKVIELDPKSHPGYWYRGSGRVKMGDAQGAVDDFSMAITLGNSDWTTYNNRGEAYFALGQYENALADFQKAEDVKSGRRIVQAGKAVTLHAMGKTDEAKTLWADLVSKEEQFKDIEWVRSELSWQDVLVSEARKLIEALEAA